MTENSSQVQENLEGLLSPINESTVHDPWFSSRNERSLSQKGLLPSTVKMQGLLVTSTKQTISVPEQKQPKLFAWIYNVLGCGSLQSATN